MKKILSAIFIIAVSATACKKATPEPEFNTSKVYPISLEFDNVFGNQNIVLNQAAYFDAPSPDFTIDYLAYYISNISFSKADGTTYTVPQEESYFLIKEHDQSTHKALVNVPEGDYQFVTFTLGVDSVRNTLGLDQRTGVLDVSDPNNEGMYWGWNSGYIFFKLEGKSTLVPQDSAGNQKYRYHIGGFGGYDAPTINNIKTIKLDLSTNGMPQVRAGVAPNVHLMVDIRKVFYGNNTLNLSTINNVMFSPISVDIANNYAEMFRHDHTEN